VLFFVPCAVATLPGLTMSPPRDLGLSIGCDTVGCDTAGRDVVCSIFCTVPGMGIC